jgi:deferrochelatase/peroxidase EfeB
MNGAKPATDPRRLGSGRSFTGAESDVVDVQNIVKTGYTKSSRRVYLLRISEPQNDVSKRLQPFVDHGFVPLPTYPEPDIVDRLTGLIKKLSDDKSCIALDVGFTFAGLKALKVRAELLDIFRRKSPAFYDNAFLRGQKHLGDTGLSSPEHWERPYRDKDKDQGGFHLALIAHFPYDASANPPTEGSRCILEFENLLAQVLLVIPNNMPLPACLAGDWVEVSVPLAQPDTEHFGYRDGITAPAYLKSEFEPRRTPDTKRAPKRDAQGYRAVHALGEILLGHARNDGDNLYAELGLTRKENTQIQLQQSSVEKEEKQFFNNSSFGVLRKMEQRVDVFEKWLDSQAKSNFLQDAALAVATNPNPGDPYYISKKWIRSKLMGRTPEGVMPTPNMAMKDIPDALVLQRIAAGIYGPGAETRFHNRDEYRTPLANDDSEGRGCPFSSHIRRMNPRDDPVTPFIHRPLIRRGMPYTQGDTKGMSGLFICADLVDQFEHLVGAWGNGRVLGVPDDSTCRDPIIGNHEPQNNVLYLNSHENGGPFNTVKFNEPFVVTKGCAYIWFPSTTALAKFKSFVNPYAK